MLPQQSATAQTIGRSESEERIAGHVVDDGMSSSPWNSAGLWKFVCIATHEGLRAEPLGYVDGLLLGGRAHGRDDRLDFTCSVTERRLLLVVLRGLQ